MAFDTAFGYGGTSFGTRRRRPLPDEEERLTAYDALTNAGSQALTGLGYLGGFIEKTLGDRAIRGTLQTLKTGNTKHLRELLSVIPGSDTLGITDPRERVSGRQLLGLSETPGFFSPESAAGIALEIGLSPATYATFGASALSKLGKVAQRAGVVPKTGALRAAGLGAQTDEALRLGRQSLIESKRLPADPLLRGMSEAGEAAKLAGQSLGGNVRFGIPFTDIGTTFNLENVPGIGKPLMRGVSALGNNPVTRRAAQLFARPAQGRSTGPGQVYGAAEYAARPIFQAELAGKALDLIDTLPASVKAKLGSPKLGAHVRSVLEGVAPAGKLAPTKAAWDQTRQWALQRGRELGLPEQELDDLFAQYVPRQADQAIVAPEQFAVGRGTGGIKAEARWEPGKGLPGGTASLNKLMREAPLADESLTARHIFENYYGLPESEFASLKQQKDVIDTNRRLATDLSRSPIERQNAMALYENAHQGWDANKAAKLASYEERMSEAQQLAGWKHKLGALTGDLYKNDPLLDIYTKFISNAHRFSRADTLYGALAKAASTNAGPGSVPVSQVLAAHGLTYVDQATGVNVPLQRMAKALGVPEDQVKNFAIPKPVADDMIGLAQKMVDPIKWNDFINFWDNATNLIKTGQTVVWPAHHVRNQMTALYQHWMHDVFDPTAKGISSYVRPWRDARSWSLGKTVQGLSEAPVFRGMTDEQATKVLQKEILKWDIPGSQTRLSKVEAAGIGGTVDARIGEIIPGKPRESWSEIFGDIKGEKGREWWRPTYKTAGGTYGGKRITEEVNPVAAVGRKAAGKLDEQNRVAAFIARVKQGHSFESAAREVNKIHFDFRSGAMADPWLRRAIPFYLWTRESVGKNVQALLSRPGGKLAQTLRVAKEARGQEPGFLPEQLGGGVAIPLGEEKDGQQRFLSSLGMSVEDLGEIVNAPVRRGVLGNLNPILKFPLEQATGTQMFSGRDLRDLYSRLNLPRDYQPLENLVMNSPVGRLFNVASTLKDERKGALAKALNLGTGIRVSDVDMERSRYAAQRKRLADEASRHENLRSYTSVFVPQRLRDQATPEELALAELYSDLAKAQKARTGRTPR